MKKILSLAIISIAFFSCKSNKNTVEDTTKKTETVKENTEQKKVKTVRSNKSYPVK